MKSSSSSTSRRSGGAAATGSGAPRPAAKKKATTKARRAVKGGAERPAETWELRLYVTGQTPRSMEAFANLRRICEEHMRGRYKLEVIDLLRNPALARGDQILAVPTLVRKLPQPVKKIIGDFSNTERVLVGLDLRPLKPLDRTR